jgi:hypothetical protein
LLSYLPFYVATNFTKLKIILVLKCRRKKFGPNFIKLFTQKIVTKLSKIWVWYPGSEIRKKTYSGSQFQGSKRHRNRNPVVGIRGSGSVLKPYKSGTLLITFGKVNIRGIYFDFFISCMLFNTASSAIPQITLKDR